jgi:hypothetical protein
MDLIATLRTDAGMHVLWDRYHFPGVVDYPTWASELVEDENIERHLAMGHIVPINIRSDGTFVINVRADEAALPTLTDNEVDWDDLATKTDANPDFVVLVGPAGTGDFRRSIATF